MSEACCGSAKPAVQTAAEQARWKRTLWIVLAINVVMFGAEVAAGILSRSAALQADALDFFSDAANYALSLGVLGMGLRARKARR
jgi:Co/Zn/Cd efflux system component